MNKIRGISITTALVLASSLLWGLGAVHASPARLEAIQPNWLAKSEPVAPAKPPKKVLGTKPSKVKKQSARLVAFPEDRRYKHGSQETEFQRSERLRRECRGAVNAGACAGYTR